MVATLEESGLAVWACNPANDIPANTINKTVILINRMDKTTASREHRSAGHSTVAFDETGEKLPHHEIFHKRFFEK
jgi:hypothetical protein